MKLLRVFLISTCLLFSFSISNTLAASSGFNDVDPSHRFYKEITALAHESVIGGFSDGSFKPENNVTRAQAAIMIVRALQLDIPLAPADFYDVSASDSASGYIAAAAAEGIITGFPDGTYQPNRTVTRGQLAILLTRAFDYEQNAPITFKDVSKSSVAYPYISKLIAANITAGYPDNSYRPDMSVTRGQFAAFLARAMRLTDIPADSEWKGIWSNPFGYISISNETTNSFNFHVNVSMGGHIGDLTGMVEKNGNQAIYTEYIPEMEDSLNPRCIITFVKSGNTIHTKEEGACFYHHGAAATFSGEFLK